MKQNPLATTSCLALMESGAMSWGFRKVCQGSCESCAYVSPGARACYGKGFARTFICFWSWAETGVIQHVRSHIQRCQNKRMDEKKGAIMENWNTRRETHDPKTWTLWDRHLSLLLPFLMYFTWPHHVAIRFAGEDMGLGLIIDTEVAKSSALVMPRSDRKA